MASHLPLQSAVQISDNIITVGEGSATDWLDVIPVSGARVALTVGSLTGTGLYAAAAMGRLRTAVHALAELDLSPDEVLGRLDALVHRITAERGSRPREKPDRTNGSVAGATCLYAIYDPASGHLTLASAGHPLPIVVDPHGEPLACPSPPGGVMGTEHDPFGTAEVDVPAGSTVALYTPGLLGDDGSAPLAGLLGHLLSTADAPSLDDVGAEIVRTRRPAEPDQDAVLLLARTQIFGEDRVVTWDLPSDPAVVATARSLVGQQLEAWNLEVMSFATQLVASELVTNAIRHGKSPITLRLLRDQALMCEVADGSTTTPHLRYAHTSDEGGRGLFMIAGKTIWTEQDLPDGPLPG